MRSPKRAWWQSYFDEYYLKFWGAKGAFRHTKKEISFLEKALPLKKRYKILDLCCGHGRHTLELARRGYDATGLDYSAYELALARAEAARKKLAVRFVRGDARNFRVGQKFDVITNLFTSSFGYGPLTDSIKNLESISRHLKKGGYFVLDTMNALYITLNYKAKETERLGGLIRKSFRHFDPLTYINREDSVIIGAKGKILKRAHTSVRIFTYPEIRDLLVSAGLKPLKVFGSLTGHKFELGSRRITVFAKKI